MSRPAFRAFQVLLLVLAFGCSSPASPTGVEAAGGGAPAGGAAATEMVSLTNAERTQAGIAPFTPSPRLMQAAQIHAEQMADLGQMAHSLPGARYPHPQDRLTAVGYEWQAYAENVAYGQSNSASVLGAWMNSSGHRANILNTSLTELGTGVARDSSGRPYYVQVFGRPR
jgi:uncharacterized protein YkwD